MRKGQTVRTPHEKAGVIVICGPTGIGKTSSALELATAFSGEIVGADSMQIYRYMDIGTAKPTSEERAHVRHHMVDIADPDEPFDAARYARMARKVVADLNTRHVTPFVVGGTGLYIKALVHGLFRPESTDPDLRSRLRETAATSGSASLHRLLVDTDPEAAARIHPNDTYRIMRALEVKGVTGKAISAHHRAHMFQDDPFRVLKIGIRMDRKALYDRIDSRTDAMLDAGLIDETEGLLARGYAPDLKSMRAIGYRHMVGFIRREFSWDEAVRTFKRDTRRYAKRQLTWFRADPEIAWFGPDERSAISRLIAGFLKGEGQAVL